MKREVAKLRIDPARSIHHGFEIIVEDALGDPTEKLESSMMAIDENFASG
jgi:hypothetical protein